uniref:Uncharacterized protein n=1 Tax=Anopheles minimus TaxID=112268 RepID=A0A182VRZ2_9DIPT
FVQQNVDAYFFRPLSDSNRALSLALASNLHIPYTIAMDPSGIPSTFNDGNGKVVIICSSINSPQTISVINQLKQYSKTKILLLDMVGTIFNSNNVLYRRLAEADDPFGGTHRPNLLVLTILTEHFRSFLHRLHGVDLGDYKHISENLLKIRLDVEEFPIQAPSFDGRHTNDEGDDGHKSTKDDEASNLYTAYGDDDEVDHLQQFQSHPPELLLELLSLAANGTNASQSCDFHYFLNHVANWYEILAQTFDSARCQTLFGSYCETDASHGGSYPNPSSSDNGTGELPSVGQTTTNQSLAATVDEIERFCDLFLTRYDKLLTDGLAGSNATDGASPPTDHLLMFGEHFYFFDFLLAVWEDGRKHSAHQHRKFQFDFVAFDFKNISHHRAAVVWRPFLILQQSQLHRHQFSMHPVPPGYADWVVEATLETIWICGVLCWAIVGLVGLIAVAMIVGSIVFSIAVR